MGARPHDVPDLYLSPVTLELDHRLGELEGLTEAEIELRIALATDRQPRDCADRASLVLLMLTHALETHGWEVAWKPRGLRVSHGDHEVVLGVPHSLRAYLDDGGS